MELSQASPHDISNVLKLYLRQVRCWWCLMAGEGGELATGTNLAGGIRHKFGSVWVGGEGGVLPRVGWPWRWGHCDPPSRSHTASLRSQPQNSDVPEHRTRNAPPRPIGELATQKGKGPAKITLQGLSHVPMGWALPLESSWGGLRGVCAPGIILGWAQQGSCPWGHTRVGSGGSLPLGSSWDGLSRVSAPQATPGCAQWGLCPWDHTRVGSAGSLPLGLAQQGLCPSGHARMCSSPAPPPCTQTVIANSVTHILQQPPPQGSSSAAQRKPFLPRRQPWINSLCCLFLTPLEGQLCVASQGKLCPWAPAHQESRTLSGLHGFSKEKQSGKRGGNQC